MPICTLYNRAAEYLAVRHGILSLSNSAGICFIRDIKVMVEQVTIYPSAVCLRSLGACYDDDDTYPS